MVNIVSEHRNTEVEKTPHISIIIKDDYYENVFQMTDHLHASGVKGHNIFTMGSKLLTKLTHFSSTHNSIQVTLMQ